MSALDLCRCGHERAEHNGTGCTATDTINLERHELWGGEETDELAPEPCECDGFEIGQASLL